MVSDQQIAEALGSLLRDSNPNAFSSLNDVVNRLQSNLGIDLSHKVDFIGNQIQLLFRSQPPPPPPPPPQQQQPHQQPKPQPIQHPQPQPQPSPQSIQPPQQPPPKDHFALHQNPNFPTTASPSQVSPNFAAPVPNPSPAAQNVSAAATTPVSPKQGAKRKGGPGGLNKLCGVSPELQVIVGQPALPRTEIVRQLWTYIRKNNLQDPSNKRKIICNDELRVVFDTDRTDMFKMNKLLAKHIITLEPSKQSGQQSKKTKVDVEPATKSTDLAPSVIISDALANFLGTGGREMLQSEVLRKIWEYIKANHLEDPLNQMVIVCDAKLRELLGCESISALGISEMLARHHLFKIS